MSRADWRENLRDGKALSRTWISPLLVTISLGGLQMGSKMVLFVQFVFGVSSLVCVVNTIHWSVEDTHRYASVNIVYSSDGRRLTCVLNNIHRSYRSVDTVYRACTVGVG